MIPIEQQVCDRVYAEKLRDLGVPQDSVWWWVFLKKDDSPNPVWESKDRWLLETGVRAEFGDDKVSAFTVAELGEMLPEEIDIGFFRQEQDLHDSGYAWKVMYYTFQEPLFETEPVEGNDKVVKLKPVQATITAYFEEETEANARAKALIWLIENGHANVNDL